MTDISLYFCFCLIFIETKKIRARETKENFFIKKFSKGFFLKTKHVEENLRFSSRSPCFQRKHGHCGQNNFIVLSLGKKQAWTTCHMKYILLLFSRLISKQTTLLINLFFCTAFETTNNAVPLTTRNFLDLGHPGVYLIYNKYKDMYYYGESTCILHRFTHHLRSLKQETHDNRALQEDYTKNPEHFEFLVLDYGPEWNNLKKRVSRQDYYIELKKEKSYNIFEHEPIVMRPLSINGIRFEAIREAVRVTGIPRTSLKRLLRDPEKPEFVILEGEEQSYGKTPIFGQKEGTPSLLFDGIVDAVAAGFARNKQNATRKLKRGDPGWRYAHFDKEGKSRRSSYTLKPGEQSFKQWFEEKTRET